MIYLKNPQQIECMRKAGALLYDVLCRLREAIKPGMSTAELDVYAEQLIRKHKAIPSFLDYNGYPASICTSINEEVVHGIPSDRVILKDGDVLSVDCGLILDGWQSDSAFTVGVGNVSPEDQKLINVTEECFFKGVRKALNGNHLGDIGHAIQTYAESFQPAPKSAPATAWQEPDILDTYLREPDEYAPQTAAPAAEPTPAYSGKFARKPQNQDPPAPPQDDQQPEAPAAEPEYDAELLAAIFRQAEQGTDEN